MKSNGVIHLTIQPTQSTYDSWRNSNNNYVGFFGKELKTCDTIEEGVKSFEKKKVNNDEQNV